MSKTRRGYQDNFGNTQVIVGVEYAGDGSSLVVPIASRPNTNYAVFVQGDVINSYKITNKTTKSFTIADDNIGSVCTLDFHII